MTSYKLYNDFHITFETPDDGYSYFFGYYDKSPLDKSNSKLLAHRVAFDGREVRDGDSAEVGYFDLARKKFHVIDETLAWNWQQGSHLQWMPPSYENEIIYNSIEDNRFVSIRYNILTQDKKVLPSPIYAIHPNGKEALAVNYERLYWCRPGYNYQNIKNSEWNTPVHPDDGVFQVDLQTGRLKLIVRTRDIVNMGPIDEMTSSNNWLEHMMYSPRGDRFLFFHRWSLDGVDKSRFFTSSKDGKEIIMYPDCGFYSHYDWSDEDNLIVWTFEPRKSQKDSYFFIKQLKERPVSKLLRPLYKIIKPVVPNNVRRKFANEPKLLMFQDIHLGYKVIGETSLGVNGHTTVANKNKLLLSDSYPDDGYFRHLYFFDITNNRKIKIGKFHSAYNDCVYRCDLHPRMSIDGESISIDSAHFDKRKTLVLKKRVSDRE